MHPRPSPAPPPSLGSAELADAAVPRWRSTTPEEDAPQPGSPSSEHSKPFTPTAAARRAPLTPAVGIDCGSTAASSAASAPTASAAARHNPGGAACTEALWRRARCFMQCVTGSPLAQSALLSLELAGAHPTVPQGLGLAPGQALQWTLAQLLVLHLKSGLPQASEVTVLASLWLLESVESCRRSAATVCLNDYLRHLAAFSQQAVLDITADWPSSFRRLRQSVVDAQRHLLKQLDWRVLPDPRQEVPLCHAMLFHVPTGAHAAGSAAARLRELWAEQMHRVCAEVQHQAYLIRSQARLDDRGRAAAGAGAAQSPTKRQRTRA